MIKFIDLDAIVKFGNYISLDDQFIPIVPTIPLVDPALQPLRSFFVMADRNSVANSIVSRPSAGDSGSRSAAANGSNGSTVGTINGEAAAIGTAYWLRLGSLIDSVNPYTAPINDFMWTTVLELTQNPVGTSPTTYGAHTRIFSDSQCFWGAFLYRTGGVNYIGVNCAVSSVSSGLSYNYNCTLPAPALNTPFVLQWGLISRKLVFRINLGPWIIATDLNLSGATQFPTDAIYYVAGQNFHFGYSGGGGTYYYNGNVGDIYSTIGTKSQDVYDQLAFYAMDKFGVV